MALRSGLFLFLNCLTNEIILIWGWRISVYLLVPSLEHYFTIKFIARTLFIYPYLWFPSSFYSETGIRSANLQEFEENM